MSLRFSAGLFAGEMVFCLGWIYRYSAKPRPPLISWLLFGSRGPDIAWLLTLVFVVIYFGYSRKKRAELAYLIELYTEFGLSSDKDIRQPLTKPGAWSASSFPASARRLRRKRHVQS